MSAVAMKPQPVSDVEMAFPAHVSHLLPDYASVPDEFKGWGSNEWVKLTEQWFYAGLAGHFIPKEGIDANEAGRHLSAVLRSFEPKHEHKIAGVAYLMSQWFERFEPTAA